MPIIAKLESKRQSGLRKWRPGTKAFILVGKGDTSPAGFETDLDSSCHPERLERVRAFGAVACVSAAS